MFGRISYRPFTLENMRSKLLFNRRQVGHTAHIIPPADLSPATGSTGLATAISTLETRTSLIPSPFTSTLTPIHLHQSLTRHDQLLSRVLHSLRSVSPMSSSNETKFSAHDQQRRAFAAAKWLYETQKAQLAQDPNRPRYSIASTRVAAQKFGAGKSAVGRQLLAIKTGRADPNTGCRVGRPSRLTEVEEQSLAFHVFMLRRENRPVSIKVVQDAADALLSRRNPPPPPVSVSWVGRWIQLNRAKEEAMLKSKEALQTAQVEATNNEEPGAAAAAAAADDDDDDDDASSESEIGDRVLIPTTTNPLSNPGIEQSIGQAAQALTTIAIDRIIMET